MKYLLTLFIVTVAFGADYIPNAQKHTLAQPSAGLIWQDNQQASELTMSYKSALSYCESLGLSEVIDWRMPTIRELSAIVDTTRTPTIVSSFMHTASGCYWASGSSSKGGISYIDFTNALSTIGLGINKECYVRCVRKPK
ncbi:MAG: DUF1566 domain-containing protein [Sulfuricurvum sp.]|nr:DUF1566 domain-containing protein [Sulfuricurvum sp.]